MGSNGNTVIGLNPNMIFMEHMGKSVIQMSSSILHTVLEVTSLFKTTEMFTHDVHTHQHMSITPTKYTLKYMNIHVHVV